MIAFGSKWFEVMPGRWDEQMPDLEKLIHDGTVQVKHAQPHTLCYL